MRGWFVIRVVLISTVYAVLFFIYANYTLGGSINGALSRWTSFCFLLPSVIAGALAIQGSLSLLKKGSGPGRNSGTQFLSGLATCMILVPVFAGIFTLLYKALFYTGISWSEITELWPDLVARITAISLFTGIVYAITDHSLGAYRGLQLLKLEALRIQTQQMNLRFESLRNQISPHFLFNSLNTISSLIHRDSRTAEIFIRHLSGLYGSVMKHYNSYTISLSEELGLVRDYGFLMQTRFEDAFSMVIDMQEDPETWYVPPMSVQILVENAVKHNRLSMESPLKVEIFIEEGNLVVRNNFIGEPEHVKIGEDLMKKPPDRSDGGLGLRNIENRYRFLTDRRIRIRKDNWFTVSIPLLKKKNGKILSK